jgi:polysaccharide export outer membrane protein
MYANTLRILALAIALSSISAQATEAPAIPTLGPHDEITVHVVGSDEGPNTPIRIGPDGYINIPFAGRFLAAGSTVEEVENKIAARLSRYVRAPQVSVSVERVRSRPVTVLGAVHAPGVLQVEGQKTLLEVLSLAGGIRDDSGYQIKIVRRQELGPLDLPGAAPDDTGRFHVAEVDLDALLEAEHPEYNIFVQPHDVITIPRARMVFVIGEVTRAGGFALSERESVSVLQALALAGGLGHSPALKRAKILRPVHDAPRKQEIALDLKSIMAGTSADVDLQQNDILFVPKSGANAAAKAAARAAVSIGSGITIWRVGNR